MLCFYFQLGPTSTSKRTKLPEKVSNEDGGGRDISQPDSENEKILNTQTVLGSRMNRWIYEHVPEIGTDGLISVNLLISKDGFGKYIAKVSCPKAKCDHVSTFGKSTQGVWAVSNFYKHCKTHAVNPSETSIKDFFSPDESRKSSNFSEDLQEGASNTTQHEESAEDGDSGRDSPVRRAGGRTGAIDSDDEHDHTSEEVFQTTEE